MKAIEFLNETPLPDTWDKDVYSKKVSFKNRVEYAKQRAAKLGAGSSRVAFNIEYEGRQTALKIAKNKKGIAQNEAEAELLSDGYIYNSGKVIPIIDYDTEQYTWIHTEMAKPISLALLCERVCALNLNQLVFFSERYPGKTPVAQKFIQNETWKMYDQNPQEYVDTFLDWAGFLCELQESFQVDIGDFARIQNWGLYKGNPVLIDLGFTQSVMQAHYS